MKLQTTFVALLWLGTLPDTLGEEGGSLFVIGGSNTGTISDPLNSTEVFTANGDLEAVVSIRRRCRCRNRCKFLDIDSLSHRLVVGLLIKAIQTL